MPKKINFQHFLTNFCRCYTLCASLPLCLCSPPSLFHSLTIVVALLSFLLLLLLLLALFTQPICFTMSYIDFFYYFLRVYPRIRYNLFAAFFSCHFPFFHFPLSVYLPLFRYFHSSFRSCTLYVHKLVGVETIFFFRGCCCYCYSLLYVALLCSLPIKEMIHDINHEVGCMKIIQNIKT